MIYQYKTDAMRELVRLVAHGYQHWTGGEVEPRKIESLSLKFADRYGVTATAQQRYRRKAKGEANAQLVCWPSEAGPVHWWLLVTEGSGLAHELEQLRDCRDKRSRIELSGYELVKTPRKGKEARAQWTWRMTKESYKGWEERLKTAVRRKSDDLIEQALYSLRRVPGFAESRRQAFALEKFAQAEWKRSQRGEWPYTALYVGWLGRYQKPSTLDAGELVKSKSARGKASKGNSALAG